jgi:hypothetical protein
LAKLRKKSDGRIDKNHKDIKARDRLAPGSHRCCRPDAFWLNRLDFSFAIAAQDQLLILPFKLLLLLFPRGRKHESGGPPLFKPSLKVEGDIAHIKPPDFQLE